MRFEDLIAYERKEASQITEKNTRIENILELLEDYGDIPQSLEEKLETIDDISILKKYHKLAARADSIEAFIGAIE